MLSVSLVVTDAGAGDGPAVMVAAVGAVEGQPATFTVSLSAPHVDVVTVDYVTAPLSASAADFVGASGTLTFPPGTVQRTVAVATIDDNIYEHYESFSLAVSNPTGGAVISGGDDGGVLSTLVSIEDNDGLPTVRVADVSASEASGLARVPVTMSHPSFQDETVDFTSVVDGLAGASDFVPRAGTLTIPAGSTATTVDVVLVDDDIEEPVETFRMDFSFSSTELLEPDTARVTIVDDDAPVVDPPPAVDPSPPAPPTPPNTPPVSAPGTPPADQTPSIPFTPFIPSVGDVTPPEPPKGDPAPRSPTPDLAEAPEPPAPELADPPDDPTIDVVVRNGEPGGLIDVTVGDVPPDCGRVYFHIGDAPAGSASVSNGAARLDDVFIPGDAGGQVTVAASCARDGDGRFAATAIALRRDGVHRSGLATMTPRWRDVSLGFGSLAGGVGAALAAVLVFGFPAELFDSTFKKNKHRIHARLAWVRRLSGRAVPRPVIARAVGFVAVAGAGAALGALLSPDAGWNMSTLALWIGIVCGVFVSNVVLRVPDNLWGKRRAGRYGRLEFLPFGLGVAALCTLLTRGLALHPGYFYATYLDWEQEVDEVHGARGAVLELLVAMAAGATAFALRDPVSVWAATDGDVVPIIVEGVLISLSLGCLESVFVALIPLRFLKGHAIARWNRPVWAVLFMLAAFLVFVLLLQPASGYIGYSTTTTFLAVIVAFVAFGLASIAFWAWMRYVPDPTPATPVNA